MAVFLQRAVSVAPAFTNTITRTTRSYEMEAGQRPIGTKSMKRHIAFGAVLGLALLNVCLGVEAKPPTCTQPVGKWKNVRGSVLDTHNYDAATGAISGQYISNSGASGAHPIVGWINSAPAESGAPGKGAKSDHAEVIAFAVQWGTLGGISAWTGTCAVNSQSSGREQISALWHTTEPNTGFDWDHTLTGSDRFDPIE
jgi:hypothetical protein